MDRFFEHRTPPRPLFFYCRSRGFLFLSVSKNACTTVKWAMWRDDAGRGRPPSDIHGFWGYAPDGRRAFSRAQVEAGEAPQGLRKFVVYRDPLERLLSTYTDKVIGRAPQDFFIDRGIRNVSFGAFMEMVEEALALFPPDRIDEHFRPQAWQYRAHEVDDIVAIEDLREYLLQEHGMRLGERANVSSGKKPTPGPSEVDLVRALYHEDYLIRPNYRPPLRDG